MTHWSCPTAGAWIQSFFFSLTSPYPTPGHHQIPAWKQETIKYDAQWKGHKQIWQLAGPLTHTQLSRHPGLASGRRDAGPRPATFLPRLSYNQSLSRGSWLAIPWRGGDKTEPAPAPRGKWSPEFSWVLRLYPKPPSKTSGLQTPCVPLLGFHFHNQKFLEFSSCMHTYACNSHPIFFF